MTLREVVVRLERLEQLRPVSTRDMETELGKGTPVLAAQDVLPQIAMLRLDIERYILKAEGRL
jgi:hypothetical protein